MGNIKLTTIEGKKIEFKLAAGKFQAVCTGGGLPICGHIGSWFGPERESQSQAEEDRDAHKNLCSHHNPEVVQWMADTEITNEETLTLTFKADLVLSCLSFFASGVGNIGIRNNCPNCMIAVIHWTPTVGTRTYSVPGYSQIIVKVESQAGQLIGEQPC